MSLKFLVTVFQVKQTDFLNIEWLRNSSLKTKKNGKKLSLFRIHCTIPFYDFDSKFDTIILKRVSIML